MKKRVFIVHRWDGSPESDWYPWFKKELKKNNFEVYVLVMPHSENPIIEDWISYLRDSVGKPDQKTYLIGHSLGGQTILRYLEILPSERKIGGVVFVASFFTLKGLTSEEKKVAKPWLETPIDLARAKQQANKFVAIFSDNDPYVSLDNQDDFKNKLGSKIIVEHQKGHFNEAAGITQLPIVLKSLLEIAKT